MGRCIAKLTAGKALNSSGKIFLQSWDCHGYEAFSNHFAERREYRALRFLLITQSFFSWPKVHLHSFRQRKSSDELDFFSVILRNCSADLAKSTANFNSFQKWFCFCSCVVNLQKSQKPEFSAKMNKTALCPPSSFFMIFSST